MARTLLMVGTRKGLWIGTSDEARTAWDWTGPHFPMEEVYSVLIDRRGDDPAPLRGLLLELARAAGLALRRPRRLLAGDPQRRDPLPGGRDAPRRLPATLARVWQLAPGVEDGVVWAGTEPGAIFRSTDRGETFDLVRGLWDHPHRQEWNEGFGGQAFHTILPHPTDGDSVLAAISTGGVYRTVRRRRLVDGVQHRGQGRVLPRRAQLPGVRPVRAQGRPRRDRAGPPLPPEPRRRLPLRRRGSVVAGHRSRAALGVRLRDGDPPARGQHGVHLPDRRRRRPLAGRRQGPRLPYDRRRRRPGSPSARDRCPTASMRRSCGTRCAPTTTRRRASTSAAATAPSGARRTPARPGRRSTRTCPDVMFVRAASLD